MGESRLPLFAFVDETGNTGHNIFDEAQPDFFTAALITPGNFDNVFSDRVLGLAHTLGYEGLHGKELGIARLEAIADPLLAILRRAKAGFFVSRVEKKYLLATKLFDTLFDSGENAAVPWHYYNIRPLRLMLAFKASALIDIDTAVLFWRCLLEPNENKAYAMLPIVCERLLDNIGLLPDERSRQVLGEALQWAKAHPESIRFYADKKLSRQGHFPNLVAFANLLDGLDSYSRTRRKSIARVTHDTQSEFERTLAAWHSMFANASPEEVRWVGETYCLQKLPGSTFEVREDANSAGIQVADIVLWLYSQLRKGKALPTKCQGVLGYVLSHGWESDFSFQGVEREYLERFGPILFSPISPEQEETARVLVKKMEEMRLDSMARYEHDHIPPFMRERSSVIVAEHSSIATKEISDG